MEEEEEVKQQLKLCFGIDVHDVFIHVRLGWGEGKLTRHEVFQLLSRFLERIASRPSIHASLIPRVTWMPMVELSLQGLEYRQTHPHDPNDPTKQRRIFVGQFPQCLSGSEALMNFLCGIVSAYKLRVTVSCCEPIMVPKEDKLGNKKEYFGGCAHFLVSRARPFFTLNRTILAEPSFVYMALDEEQRLILREYTERFRCIANKSKLHLPTPCSCVTFARSKKKHHD